MFRYIYIIGLRKEGEEGEIMEELLNQIWWQSFITQSGVFFIIGWIFYSIWRS